MEEKHFLVDEGLPIRAYDVDAMGYVNNIVYIRWFEDLRHYFLDLYLPFDKMMEKGISPVLIHTQSDYQHHLTIHDKPRGRIWLKDAGVTKWKMAFEIYQHERIHCVGEQWGYFLDLKNQRPTPLPEELRRVPQNLQTIP
ncbi:MAG: thioesterase family protein [Spirochaetaceae bacterium]|jgi:acyl-CoA thioester hydrolase|nr:thioesterase family protein [Spirochaetaceae bacterium]